MQSDVIRRHHLTMSLLRMTLEKGTRAHGRDGVTCIKTYVLRTRTGNLVFRGLRLYVRVSTYAICAYDIRMYVLTKYVLKVIDKRRTGTESGKIRGM